MPGGAGRAVPRDVPYMIFAQVRHLAACGIASVRIAHDNWKIVCKSWGRRYDSQEIAFASCDGVRSDWAARFRKPQTRACGGPRSGANERGRDQGTGTAPDRCWVL